MSITADERIAFFVRGSGTALQSSTRRDVGEPFPPPTTDPPISAIASLIDRSRAEITGDGAALYVSVNNTVRVASRTSTGGAFGLPQAVLIDGAPLSATMFEISSNGRTLYWAANGIIHEAVRGANEATFGPSRVVFNQPDFRAFTISADELVLYSGTLFTGEVRIAMRATKDSLFADVGVAVAGAIDEPVAVSPDGCRLYVVSYRTPSLGSRDIWVSAGVEVP